MLKAVTCCPHCGQAIDAVPKDAGVMYTSDGKIELTKLACEVCGRVFWTKRRFDDDNCN